MSGFSSVRPAVAIIPEMSNMLLMNLSEVQHVHYSTQNPTSSGWLQSILFLSRFHTLKKRDEIKYVYLRLTYLGNTRYEFIPSIQNPVLSIVLFV